MTGRPLAWPSAPVGIGGLALVLAALLLLATRHLQAPVPAAVRPSAGAPAQPPQAAPGLMAPSDDQLLVAALPPATDGAGRVLALLALASAQGVTVDHVRQAAPLALAAGKAALPAERITLQVRASGPYLGLRQWVALALQHDDALLLERLRLSRPTAGSTVLAADLGWALLQAQPPLASVGPTPAALALKPTTPPALATRPGDWPAPRGPALAAWQGRPADPAPPPRLAVAAASAPARPAPAEFPYRWIGQLDDGSGLQVLLASAQRSFGVRLGEVIDQRWRIDRAANGSLQARHIDSDEVMALRTLAATAQARP